MASIERTAYPRFKKVVSARELYEVFTPTPAETAWAREATRKGDNLLVLVVLLKAFQRLGYFPRLAEVPVPVVVYVRRSIGLGDDVIATADSSRTLERYRSLIRDRVGVTYIGPLTRPSGSGVGPRTGSVEDRGCLSLAEFGENR